MGMTSNRDNYLCGIGDKYYIRRKPALTAFAEQWEYDPIIMALKALDINTGKYLEIGCSDGWRLKAINENIGMSCYGVEPSLTAIENAKYGCIQRGTADKLDFGSNLFEVVAFGFFFFFCDNEDLFKIASEADRVVTDDGYIVIYDFIVDGIVYRPNPDCPSMQTRKMDCGKMFEWHPSYTQIYKRWHRPVYDTNSVDVCVNVFKKKG